jgi:hypothetical protein
MTESTECTFVVKESDDGIPYVVAEPTMASGQMIGFDLTPGATLDDALKVAKFMRDQIRSPERGLAARGAEMRLITHCAPRDRRIRERRKIELTEDGVRLTAKHRRR